MKRQNFLFILFLFIFLLGSISTAFSYTGEAYPPILNFVYGTRALSLGGAYVSVANDVYYMDSNPAAGDPRKVFRVSFMHQEWIEDTNFEALRVSYGLGNQLFLGAGFTYLYTPYTYYDMTGASDGNSYNISQSLGMFNIGYKLKNYDMAFGTTVKILYNSVPDELYDGQSYLLFAADTGFIARTHLLKIYEGAEPSLNFGLALRNIGYSGAVEKLPTEVHAGVSYRVLRNLMVSAEIAVPFYELPYGSVGVEFDIDKIFFIQGGVQLRENPIIGIGLGYRWKDIDINMSYTPSLVFRNMMNVSVGFTLGEPDGPVVKVWKGGTKAGPENWGEPRNWKPAGVPGTDDDVLIPLTDIFPVIVDDAICNNLTVETDATLTVNGGLLEVGGNLQIDGTVEVNEQALTVDGDIIGIGHLNAGNTFEEIELNSSISVNQFTASSGTTYVAGNWGINTFNHNYGTVSFVGSEKSSIYGNNTFNIFTCTTAGKTLEFAAGSIQTIYNFTITGQNGKTINLRSNSSVTRWKINTLIASVYHTEVKDSDASRGNQIITNNSIDGGNNVNWNFPGDTGLAGHWEFDGNTKDSVGTNDGKSFGNPSYISEGMGGSKAVDLNGGDRAEMSWGIQDDFTIAFWVKTSQTGSTGTQWYHGAGLVDANIGDSGDSSDESGDDSGVGFGTSLFGDKCAFGVGDTGTTIISASSINDDEWHHVAATRNKTTGAIELYVDGVNEASGKATTESLIAPVKFSIGANTDGKNYFKGSIDELRIYNKVLSEAEIFELFNNNKTLTPNLIYPELNTSGNAYVEFTLPEPIFSGSLKMTFAENGTSLDQNDPHVIIFNKNFESTGQHTTTFISTDLSNNPNVLSVNSDPNDTLIEKAVYDVTIEYQDERKNPPASDTSTGFLYTGEVTILSRETVDTDGNGQIDRVKMTASEPVNDDFSSIAAVVGSYKEIGFDTGDTPNDVIFYITFKETGLPDTGETPDAQITVNKSLMNNAATRIVSADAAGVTVTDRAEPSIVSARTVTTNTVEITFSESINAVSVKESDFMFSGFKTKAANTSGKGFDIWNKNNDNKVIISLAAEIGTEETGKVQIKAVGDISDMAGNKSKQTATVEIKDGVPPVITSAAISEVGFITLVITFSEAVYTNPGAGDLVVTDFVYHNLSSSGAGSIKGMAGIDGGAGSDGVIEVGPDVPFIFEDFDTDKISASTGEIYDEVGNVADETIMLPIMNVDNDVPTISKLVSADTDNNGYLDRLIVTFDDDVDDRSIIPANFVISEGVSVISVTDDGKSQDAVIWVDFTDGILSLDAIPTLTIRPGGIKDINGNGNELIHNFKISDGSS
jgi:hypothetical protein